MPIKPSDTMYFYLSNNRCYLGINTLLFCWMPINNMCLTVYEDADHGQHHPCQSYLYYYHQKKAAPSVIIVD